LGFGLRSRWQKWWRLFFLPRSYIRNHWATCEEVQFHSNITMKK
jgi:hypothetical protein